MPPPSQLYHAGPLSIWQITPVSRPVPGRLEYRIGGLTDTLFFEVEGLDLPVPDTTPALLTMLLPAMRRKTNLVVEGTVDPLLLRQLPGIQRLLADWMPRLTPIEVQASPGRPLIAARQTGVFFSGGADSWYSLVKYAGMASHALHIWGFDIKLHQQALAAMVHDRLKPAIEKRGLTWVRIRTNLRDLTDAHTCWEKEQNGCALAAVAALFNPQLGRIVIPGTDPFARLIPYATHPTLDPLWSTSGCLLIHDGVEATRQDKCRLLGSHADAMDTLRVCFENPSDTYNCGRCLKCTTTMLAMLMADPESTWPSFQVPLRPEAIAQVRVSSGIWLDVLRHRRDDAVALLAERSDLRPYVQALNHRLLQARAMKLLCYSGLGPISRLLAPPCGFATGWTKR